MGRAFEIEEANTYVRLFNYDPTMERVLRSFSFRNLAKWGKVPGEVHGTSKMEITHVFATFTPDRKEYRLAKGFYPKLERYLTLQGYTVDDIPKVRLPTIEAKKVKFDWLKGEVIPRDDDQKSYVEFGLRDDKPVVVFNIRTGGGKALSNDTLVQTPYGWKPIGEMKVGDEVIAKDGSITNVIGVYPQGVKKLNRIKFWDGRSRRCCDEHLWNVYDERTRKYETINTLEIKQRLSLSGHRLYIDLIKPFATPTVELKIPPRTLGESIAKKGQLIPRDYLESSLEQRTELLEGILSRGDNDSITVENRQMGKDIQKLAWSLGYVCKILDQQNGSTFVTVHKDREDLRIMEITDSDEGKATCISVDHPKKLFVIEDYIVTHNTLSTVMVFVTIGERVLITILPRYVPVWIKTFREFLKFEVKDVINVSDFEVNDLYKRLGTGEIDPKVIIFQLTRIDTYIKRMKELPDTIPHLDEFFNRLGCGIRVIDEAHESIYSIYQSLLYGNVKKTIALSATLAGDDDFINEVYGATFTPDMYLKPPVYDKYIHVISYLHRLNQQRHRINTKGFGGYSHVLYEKGILRGKGTFEAYYQICKKAFVEYYITGYREGQKAMWFFATIAFCKKFEERLKKDYPDLDIFTFTGEVSKKKGMEEEYNNHQIVITTPGSCGTAKDIAKLYIVFACVCISSTQRNDQMNGRTRPIDKWWPDLDPIFLYFTCLDIPKQCEYDSKRRLVLKKKTKKFEVIDSSLWI